MKIHFLKSMWSDIIILQSDDKIALIDTGFQEQYKEIKSYLSKLKVKNISFILLTHFHKDHYGSIENIIKQFNVEKVYFKNYSCLDSIAANGTIADEKYRNDEYEKQNELKKLIDEKSTLVEVEDLNTISFDNYTLKLFNNNNSIKEIYEDASYKNSYHKILYSENQNSLAILLKVNCKNILLGGDIFDKEDEHPKANCVNYKIATSINEEIDIYKVPHHGTNNCNSIKTLDIYKPKIAVITNGDEYLKNNSSIYSDLINANKDVKILLTEENNIVINILDNGDIIYEKC